LELPPSTARTSGAVTRAPPAGAATARRRAAAAPAPR
jgi:hypothetical protein